MNDDRITEQLQLLKKYISLLESIAEKSPDEFFEDDILKGAAQRYLQLAIESCLNIGNRIISLLQVENDIKSPNTYSDIFVILAELNVLPRDFTDKLIPMARFRNRLVHVYWEIDDRMVWDILHNNLSDIKDFIAYVKKYLFNVST